MQFTTSFPAGSLPRPQLAQPRRRLESSPSSRQGLTPFSADAHQAPSQVSRTSKPSLASFAHLQTHHPPHPPYPRPPPPTHSPGPPPSLPHLGIPGATPQQGPPRPPSGTAARCTEQSWSRCWRWPAGQPKGRPSASCHQLNSRRFMGICIGK